MKKAAFVIAAILALSHLVGGVFAADTMKEKAASINAARVAAIEAATR